MRSRLPVPGTLCKALWAFQCNHAPTDTDYFSTVTNLREGDYFVFLESRVIPELYSTECIILFNNSKMWFNIRPLEDILYNVRGVESYDIPFTTIAKL